MRIRRPFAPRLGAFRHDDWPSTCLDVVVINSLSVDVEDYFQTECMSPYAPRYTWESLPSRVVQNTIRLLDLFDEYEVKGTFFFLGWVAERYAPLVRETVARGHEIGCHSYAHHPVYRLTPESFRADTIRAKQVIEDAAGVPVNFYRAPSFSIVRSCSWAFAVLSELGFTQDSSVHPISHPTYGNPNAPRRPWQTASGLIEYPIATWRMLGRNFPVGGGAYLRIFPYQFVKAGVRSLNREGVPAVLYLHPWEIDPGQPRIATELKSRLRQYTGLHSMEAKLRHLMTDFELAPITQAFANVPLLQAPLFGQVARAEAA